MRSKDSDNYKKRSVKWARMKEKETWPRMGLLDSVEKELKNLGVMNWKRMSLERNDEMDRDPHRIVVSITAAGRDC